MSDVLMSSIEEKVENDGGVMIRSFSLTGDPHLGALVDAVKYDYHRVTGRPRLTLDDMRAMDGAKVTILRTGESMFGTGSIQAHEGTIFLGSGGRVAYLPKGKRKNGVVLTEDGVLDIELGYNKGPVLAERVAQVRATFPQVEKLTKDHLLALPDEDNGEEEPPPAQIGLVIFGTWRGPEGASPGAIWFLHTYIRDGDIAEGCLIVRPEHGVSEHGSVYGESLLRWGGRVTNAVPMTFAQALELTDLEYPDALARVSG